MKSLLARIVSDPQLAVSFGDDRPFLDRGELGRGGMATVRRVWDPRILRETALKTLDPGADPVHALPWFVEEAQITGQLGHPNIVPVHEFGVDTEGVPYLSLKLVEGETLADRVARLGEARLGAENLGDLVQTLGKVCDAVAYAHSRGVVHRDLKPSNVMCGEFGEVYVLDWGVACLVPTDDARAITTSRGRRQGDGSGVVGTPSFMSPEQAGWGDGRVDRRTDVFALGALLYFVLTGRPPFPEGEDTLQSILLAHLGEFPAPSDIPGLPPIPPQLERIALKAMSREPGDRYPAVGELRAELDRFLRGTASFPTRRWPAGAPVLREGDPGDEAYVVLSGSLEVSQGSGAERRVLRTLGPGACFGEVAVFTRAPRTADVTALTDVEAVVVTRAALEEGLGLNTWFGAFVTAVAERFVEAEGKLRRGGQ